MKNKENPMDLLKAFTMMMQNPDFYNIFGGMPKDPVEKSPYEDLGDGFELRPIEILAEGGQFVLDNREKYSNLYHKGVKISNEVFRKGGMSNGFREGYACLIQYTKKRDHTKKQHGFDFGTHVIVNCAGKIVLSGTGISSYPSHYGRDVGKVKDTFYNLLNGEEIITCSSSGTINSENYIFVEHRYDWYNKNLPLGIYQIDKNDCTLTKIDNIKK